MDNDDLSPLQRVQATFGARSDGVSYETKRALIEHGEGDPSISYTPPAPAVIPASPGIGGPSPSQDLLDRVRKQQATQGAANLQRIMEQRARIIQDNPVEEPRLGGGIYR